VSARAAALGVLLGLVVVACGAPKVNAAVTVTLDGVHHVCNVELSAEAHPSSIACSDIVPFLRDELRLPSGAVYDLRSDQTVDAAELATVSANLKGAGYRPAR
jgi:hypothetical protein